MKRNTDISLKNKIIKIYRFLFKHKGLTFLSIFIIVLSVTFIAIFPEIFSTYRYPERVKFLSQSQIEENGASTSLQNEIALDYTLSTTSQNTSNNYIFFIAENDKRYYHFFKDINEKEWPIFNFFELGKFWENRYTNDGPIEKIADNGIDDNKSSSSTDDADIQNHVAGIALNPENKNFSTEKSELVQYINRLTSVSNDKFTLADNLQPIVGENLHKLFLKPGSNSLSKIDNNNDSLGYTNFSSAPFILRINDGNVYIINNLVTKSNILSSAG